MENPIDLIESIPGAITAVKKSVEFTKWIIDEYQQRRKARQSSENEDDERMDECFLKTLYILRQESDRKKMEYIKCFAQNTILSETCAIDNDAILGFLMDIEQMTWRQICFIEGFNRRHRNDIKIKGMETSDVNGAVKLSEMRRLVNLAYLSDGGEGKFYFISGSNMLSTDRISIQRMGTHLATLMDLKLIPVEEIAKVFGTGMISETKTY